MKLKIIVRIGDRYYHPIHGWYEIVDIVDNQTVEIKFDNTKNIKRALKYHVINGKVKDEKSKFYHQVGESYTNKYGRYEIIKILPHKKALVKFENTGTIVESAICNIKKGKIKDFNSPEFYGIGYIGSFRNYNERPSKDRAYTAWRNMLMRCYDGKVHIKRPTYTDCTVCDEWHNYSNFKRWFDENYIEGNVLDKDILVKGNKVYSPDTCCFVPNEINALLTKRQNYRGKLPIGVCYSESKIRYKVEFTCFSCKKYVGYFSTSEEAFEAYKNAKEEYIKEVAEKYYKEGKISEAVYNALMNYKVEITD